MPNGLIYGTNASKIGNMLFWVSNSIHPLEQIQDSIKLHASLCECSNILFTRKLKLTLNVHNRIWMGNTCSATKTVHLVLPSWVHKVSASNLLQCRFSSYRLQWDTVQDSEGSWFQWQNEIKKQIKLIYSRKEVGKSHQQPKAMSLMVPRTSCSSEASWSANKPLNHLGSKCM